MFDAWGCDASVAAKYEAEEYGRDCAEDVIVVNELTGFFHVHVWVLLFAADNSELPWANPAKVPPSEDDAGNVPGDASAGEAAVA